MISWLWHQLDHMRIICTSLQTDNHASTSPPSFLQAGCLSCCPTNSVKAQSKVHYTKAPFTRYNLSSNRLSNGFDNWVNVCIHDTTGCQIRCQTGCQTGLTNGCVVYTAGCQTGLYNPLTTVLNEQSVRSTRLSNRLSNKLSNEFDNRFDNRVE